MSRAICIVLMFLSVHVTARAVPTVAKRDVLSDLSGGFCRSYKFGANIVNDVLYMIGLDGGIIPGDNNGTHNYLVELDLSAPIDISDGASYKMSLVSYDVPKLKDQALWSNRDNTTLFSYGGRGASDTSPDDGVWTYNITDGSWQVQQTSVKPVRLLSGAYVDVPEIQSAYWLGGYQDSDTSPSITDDTKNYATGMIQFNTTSEEFTQLRAPFTPVEEGALVYIPIGELGILVFFGGEVPSIQNGIDAELTPNAWNYVQVYDIATDTWYNQTTTGDVAPRTQFCASVVHDPTTSSYQIYAISGADFETQDVMTDISYLSIPSFKWYRAGGLARGRMTHSCQAYGRQIFGIGGRQAWADNSTAGCYDVPAFIYDAQSEVIRWDFDPALFTYSIPSATADDIETSPTPSTWADPALQTALGIYSSPPTTHVSSGHAPTNKGAVAGGVVGGIAGAAIILALIYLFIRYRRRKAQQQPSDQAVNAAPVELDHKTPVRELAADDAAGELDERNHARTELHGDVCQVHELDSQVVGQQK
ncbi:hypothetical protein BDW59DRAFT_138116 [Aspergillus cavernicola]|uniref:Kelch repeat protein n=1 Tax=Aspergillus cavernicola TaxID=176166 RepID=A0ABR4J127_9EURO